MKWWSDCSNQIHRVPAAAHWPGVVGTATRASPSVGWGSWLWGQTHGRERATWMVAAPDEAVSICQSFSLG